MRTSMPSRAPVMSRERATLLWPSPTNAKLMSSIWPSKFSVMVRMSASIWVGCQESVRPFHTGTPAMLRERFDGVLGETAELDGVEHAAQHFGGVRDGLLAAHVGAGRVEVGDVGALVVGGDFERAAGAGRALLEDEGDVLARQQRVLGVGCLGALQSAGMGDEVEELLLGEVEFLEQRAGVAHQMSFQIPSRWIGQVMQRAPPRPRPSSLPGMEMTSMPWSASMVLVTVLRS